LFFISSFKYLENVLRQASIFIRRQLARIPRDLEETIDATANSSNGWIELEESTNRNIRLTDGSLICVWFGVTSSG